MFIRYCIDKATNYLITAGCFTLPQTIKTDHIKLTQNRLANQLQHIRRCTICSDILPLGARPILQASAQAKILIAGQAPGVRVHESGIPFNDPSGDRLRDWLGINRDTFYDDKQIAIIPMAFCYPGTGKSGDLPPPKICAEQWRQALLTELPNIQLTLVIGSYAQQWHLNSPYRTLTDTVKAWREFGNTMPLPHPSPRNNLWLKKNPWFEQNVLPNLQKRIQLLL